MRLQEDGVTTVRDVVALELIRAAEPTVVCGEHALDRPVRWVHVGEIPDIARFLLGGEVVLTAGLGVGFTEREQAGYVASLAQAGVVALVIEVAGRAFSELPAALIRAGREAGLPIIAVAREFPFEAVTTELHRRIVNGRVDLLEAVDRISHRFEELVANDGDYAAIVAMLAELVGAPAVLENSARQVCAYAGADTDSDDLLSAWDAHSRGRHAEEGKPRHCLRVAVLLRGEPWGYLHVLHHGGGPAPAVLPYAAERAATFIAIALLNDRVARARSTLHQTALLHRLFDGELSGPEFVKLALTLGTDLRGGPVIGVALAPDAAGDPDGIAADGLEKAESVALGLRRAGFAVLAGAESDCSLLVVGLGNRRPGGDVRAALEGAGIIAGISGEVTAGRVRAAVQQARRAFDVAASGIKGPVLTAGDLGIYGLLAELAEGTQLAQFVENELGPLLSRDAVADRCLLPTLSMYVDTGFNKAESAARLHIQRRTFYYRLDKIAAALGHDLDAPDNRVRLHVALAGLRLLRTRAARIRSG